MKNRVSKSVVKININMLKEIGYILLLITFFVGVLIGSFSLKNVSDVNFQIYEDSLKGILTDLNSNFSVKSLMFQGLEIIGVFWIVGMSIVGTPVLIALVGYKGFSIGYTISTILKIFGTSEGNSYIFQNLFLQNVIIVFIMIFLANYSIKIFRNFFGSKENIKVDVIKYTIISTFVSLIYLLLCVVLKIIS